uniref:Uncharacterized protein n=1 Tax=Knipowitschia caucasica TaxID=637954 RepID=A0AAV2LAA8_KNICA
MTSMVNRDVPRETHGSAMEQLIESLERKLQRPLLAKSRTLPSIPQSPTVSRGPSDLISRSPPLRKSPSTESQGKACTLPPAGNTHQLCSQTVFV